MARGILGYIDSLGNIVHAFVARLGGAVRLAEAARYCRIGRKLASQAQGHGRAAREVGRENEQRGEEPEHVRWQRLPLIRRTHCITYRVRAVFRPAGPVWRMAGARLFSSVYTRGYYRCSSALLAHALLLKTRCV